MGVQNSRKSGLHWSGGKPGPREVYLGVFGKHPGWDDHIDDIGLETDRLAAVKRLLYSEGIGGNIDSGAWEKLDEAQRLSSFGHEFVWRLGGDVLVGRIWASRDGKGRTRYPMGVVAQCLNVPAAVVEAEIMARLEEVERRCIATTSAAEVRQTVESVRAQMRAALSSAPTEDSYGDLAPPTELAAGADSPHLAVTGEPRVGLYRVLYEMDRELGAFRPVGKSDSRKTTRLVDTRAQHLRVPACSSSSFAAARLWFGVLATQIDPTASMLALRPHGKGFIDLIVGEPAPQQLFCVKASEKGLAPASEVPYTLDAEFVKKCAAIVEAWRADLPAPGAQAAPHSPAPEAGTPAQPAPAVPGAPSQASKKPGWLKWGGIGAALVLIAGGAYLATRPSGVGGQSDKGPTTGSGKVALGPVTTPPPDPTKSAPGRKTAPETDAQAKQREIDAAAAKEREADALAAKQREADAAAAKQREADALAAKQREADAAKQREADALAAKQREADALGAKKDALIRAATDLEALLAIGYGPDDNPGNGTVRSRAAALTGDPLFGSLRDATPELAQLGVRLETLEKITSSAAAPFLTAQAGGERLPEGLAAWSRLASGAVAGWPATAADLEGAAKTLDKLRKAAGAIADKARAAEVGRRLSDDGKKVWSVYFQRAAPGDPPGIGAACGLMAAFGVTKDDLPARARFDVLLNDLRRDAAALGPIKPGDAGALAKARDRISAFAKEVSALGLGADGAGAVGVAETLAKALAAPTGFDPAKSGPGLRGWKGRVGDAGGTVSVVYVWPPEGTPRQTIEFLRVETAAGPAFVATTEATLGLVIDAVGETNRWADLMALLPEYGEGMDPRSGARVWDWKGGGKGITVSVPTDGFPLAGWLSPIPQLKGVQYYPDNAVPAPPSLQCPMQFITAPGALYVARLVGCRLPTVTEWKAAADRAGASAAPDDIPNRRDRSWALTQSFLANETKTKSPPPRFTWPDEGTFPFPGGRPPSRRSAEAAVETDDGLLWFSEQPSGGGGRFKHLIGNVAEFVLEASGTFDAKSDPTLDEVRRALGAKGDGVKVIGASALSPKEIVPQTPYPLDPLFAEKAAYSDVGFRLAFPASGAAQAIPPDLGAALAPIKFLSWK